MIEDAVGIMPELPEGLAVAMGKDKIFEKISSAEKDLADFLYKLC